MRARHSKQSQSGTWREQKNCEEEKHTGARRCALGFHDIEQRQVSIQRQSPESTDRSPLVSVAGFFPWPILVAKNPALAGKARTPRHHPAAPPSDESRFPS